jgi:hypothetical protein
MGPSDPTDYSQLRERLENSHSKLPPLYREKVYQPYVAKLNQLGTIGFTSILLGDPNRARLGLVMLDIAQSILQNGESYNKMAIDAFQEVVSDLYDGFLSAEDRSDIKPPDHMIIPPLVKFGEPAAGPYTINIEAAKASFDVQTTIVSLPPAHARYGLMGWASLGHECGGHDILNADDGLLDELSNVVRNALEEQEIGSDLPEYWSSRVSETASDVLGILNMGYAAGLGVIGYFRGINDALDHVPKLRNVDGGGPHPLDILRGYLAASTVRLLSFKEAIDWGKVIETETDKDVSTIIIQGKKISTELAKKSAEIVARAIVKTKLKSLENHSLGEIQNWRDQDENIVNGLVTILTTANQLPKHLEGGIYAAHVVAAAVVSALTKNADLEMIFNKMLIVLKIMHDTNPSWGPLFIRYPSDAFRHLIYDLRE